MCPSILRRFEDLWQNWCLFKVVTWRGNFFFYILIWLKMTILCIFFVRTLPYWHRCINSTVNSNHSIIVLQGAASCHTAAKRRAGICKMERGERWTFENDAVARCSGLCNFVPLTQRTQKQPFSKRKVWESLTGEWSPIWLLGLCFQLLKGQFYFRFSKKPYTEMRISRLLVPCKCTDLCMEDFH